MKRFVTAILVFGLMTGLLFLGLYESRGQSPAMGTGATETGAEQAGRSEKAERSDQTEQTEGLKKIALTFDDGPHPTYTEQLLDGLKERGVVVTFFVTGEHAELHPDIIKRMQEDA